MTKATFQNTFDVSLPGGGDIQVRRHFDVAEGSIDLDITFKPTEDRLSLSMLDIHMASLNIAIHHLQQMLEKAKATKQAGPAHPTP
jgi:hypothetical protein